MRARKTSPKAMKRMEEQLLQRNKEGFSSFSDEF